MNLRYLVRSWWHFLIVERVGYRREPPLSPYDHSLRREAERRLADLEIALLHLDIRADLSTGRRTPKGHL